jgi:hypothetical protein
MSMAPLNQLLIGGLVPLGNNFIGGSNNTIYDTYLGIVMVLGVLPLFGCLLKISLSKMIQKYGVILLSHERWWHAQLPFSLQHAQKIVCNLTFGGKWSTKAFFPVSPRIGPSFSIRKGWDFLGIFGTLVGSNFCNGRRPGQILPFQSSWWFIGQFSITLWFVLRDD